MRRTMLAVVCGTAVAVAGWSYFTRPNGGPADVSRVNAASADAVRDKTGLLEQELTAELQARARGLALDDDVDAAQVNLAKARHDVAAVAGDRDEMTKQDRVILAVRERQWQRIGLAIEHGTISEADADDVRRRLAVARFRLAELEGRDTEAREQLQVVAVLCDQQVQRLVRAYARRAVTLQKLNAARYRAGCARYVVAKRGESSADVRAETDRAISLWEAEAVRVGRLHETGAASAFESYQARRYLVSARLRRATLDRNAEAAAEQLRLRNKLDEEKLLGLDPADPFLKRMRPVIEWLLAFDRLSLARLQQTGDFPPDTAAADLDG